MCLPCYFVPVVYSQNIQALCLPLVLLSCVNSPQRTGFQTYATGVSSWIKREEEPPCSELQDLEKEEISADPSTGQ